jgi:hypothetical protein
MELFDAVTGLAGRLCPLGIGHILDKDSRVVCKYFPAFSMKVRTTRSRFLALARTNVLIFFIQDGDKIHLRTAA